MGPLLFTTIWGDLGWGRYKALRLPSFLRRFEGGEGEGVWRRIFSASGWVKSTGVFGGTKKNDRNEDKNTNSKKFTKGKRWFDVFFGEGDLHRTNPIGGKDVFCSFKFPWIQNKQLNW